MFFANHPQLPSNSPNFVSRQSVVTKQASKKKKTHWSPKTIVQTVSKIEHCFPRGSSTVPIEHAEIELAQPSIAKTLRKPCEGQRMSFLGNQLLGNVTTCLVRTLCCSKTLDDKVKLMIFSP